MASGTDYAKLKVADLKDILKSRDLPITGLKADLVARLIQADQGLLPSAPPAIQGQPEPTPESPAQPEQPPANGKRPAEEPSNGDQLADTNKRQKTSASPQPPQPPSFPSAPSPPHLPASPTQQLALPIQSAQRPNSADPTDLQAKAQAEVEASAGEGEDDDGWVDYDALLRQEHQEQANAQEGKRPKDLYLDTISRPLLDFDFERLCSTTLTHNNIYCCLVCGRYFSGRGRSTPAYAHAISDSHHVFISLVNQTVWVLPDGYEVNDPSLADIQYALAPTFTKDLVKRLDGERVPKRDLNDKAYWPGFVGLNNMKSNSYLNAILHSLVHVPPLRDYFLLTPLSSFPHPASSSGPTELVRRFAEFVRKVWNPRLFKAQVSPHELLQEVGTRSDGRFRITEAGDPVEFLGWILNTLHRDLGGSKKDRSSIIYSTFRGHLRVEDQTILKQKVTDRKELREGAGGVRFDVDREIKTTHTPFLFLALDLPPPPLFQDVQASNIIPQVPLSQVLQKYDGETAREENGLVRRYKVEKLPRYLICVFKRFLSNRFLEEKNPTIVNFGVRGVEMKDYVDSSSSSSLNAEPTLSTLYDLVSNLTHSSTAGTAKQETAWKVQLHLRNQDQTEATAGEEMKWFEVCDLDVKEVEEGLVSLGESYVQIWERRPLPDQAAEETVVEVSKAKKKSTVKAVGGQDT
ncbi:hypothetical protein JCM11641_001393 [Rhodosporidiobolus odoratus]